MSLKWFAIGLGLGTAAAILYAPKTGAETREILRDKANDALGHAAEKNQEEHYTISDVLNEEKKSPKGTAQATRNAMDATADKFREVS
jgi:gas vesicle protein